jgi:hypothetical protein
MADKQRNSALMLSTASTETVYKGETTKISIIQKTPED